MDTSLTSSSVVSPVSPSKARKRIQQPEKWKRNVAKRLRYSPNCPPEHPSCSHNTKQLQCSRLRMADIMTFHTMFYASKNKLDQDNFLLRNIVVTPVKRRRPKNERHQSKTHQTKYYVKRKEGVPLPVCQKTFLKILQITRSRVEYVAKTGGVSGSNPVETRGGDRKSGKFMDRRNAVMKFLSSLVCVESHYCRGSSVRKYLSSSLNITKLWKLYNSQSDKYLVVKQSFFRNIFALNFNLGFGGPRTDMCSTCISFGEQLRRETDLKKRNDLMTARRIHKLRAQAFYDALRCPDPDVLILSFDLQKNLVLPKVPDQQAYYSRQLYLHNFTVVQGTSRALLTPRNCFSYVWTEDLFPKGANQVASALYHCLQTIDISEFTKVRLVSDGCGGQNKNKVLLSMCMTWLLTAPENITELELYFPVRGHSFIPPDRVFGNLEKAFKRHEVIPNPEGYLEIMKNNTTLYKAALDFQMLDWHKEANAKLKQTGSWHFQISTSKRIILKRHKKNHKEVLVRGEQFYKSDIGCSRYLTKKSCSVADIIPEIIPPGNLRKVGSAKLKDIEKLLTTHYGEQWRQLKELHYYKEVLSRTEESVSVGDDHPLCEPMEDEVLLRI